MQFLSNLFGGNAFITAMLALVFVVALIVLGLWVLKITFNTSANLGRPRHRRLSVVDAVQLDSRRRVVIVRRDEVEHVILTGGAQDLVIESAIPAEVAAARRPQPSAPAPAQEAAPPPPPAPAEVPAPAFPPPAAQAAPPRPPMFRKPMSIRHTGLLRSVNFIDSARSTPKPGDNSAAARSDSAKTAVSSSNGQEQLGGTRAIGDGPAAEGH